MKKEGVLEGWEEGVIGGMNPLAPSRSYMTVKI